MNLALQALEDNGTWEITELPEKSNGVQMVV